METANTSAATNDTNIDEIMAKHEKYREEYLATRINSVDANSSEDDRRKFVNQSAELNDAMRVASSLVDGLDGVRSTCLMIRAEGNGVELFISSERYSDEIDQEFLEEWGEEYFKTIPNTERDDRVLFGDIDFATATEDEIVLVGYRTCAKMVERLKIVYNF